MKKIIKNITLNVSYINKNIINSLIQKIKKTFTNYCSEKHGYFLKIYDEINILDNFIKNDKIIFKVEIIVDNIKPEKNKIYNGVVKMISPDGLFIIVDNVLNILCCKQSLSDFNYNKKNNTYEKNDDIININDIVQVEVIDLLYNNHKYSVFGNFVKKI
jgi:DNA-directed RNA polymerase subunit E'/Rpb7